MSTTSPEAKASKLRQRGQGQFLQWGEKRMGGVPESRPMGAGSNNGSTSMPRDETLSLSSPKNIELKATSEEVDASELLLSFAGGSRAGEGSENDKSTQAQSSENGSALTNGGEESMTVDKYFSQALEYAAGVALREHVLQPVLNDLPVTSHTELEAAKFLGSYSRGTELFLEHNINANIVQASIERICPTDSPTLDSWWDYDKCLSYSNVEWSDWWVKRCHGLDSGCEMIKLMTTEKNDKRILGVAYYERNLVDVYDHHLKKPQRVRISLIRGIRVAPKMNPEVIRRSDKISQSSTEYKGIASLLFCHILLQSLRYGTQCIGVHSPKNELAEGFYESFMGAPYTRHEGDGRRYYRMSSKTRWSVLKEAFQRQVLLQADYQQQKPNPVEKVLKNEDSIDQSAIRPENISSANEANNDSAPPEKRRRISPSEFEDEDQSRQGAENTDSSTKQSPQYVES